MIENRKSPRILFALRTEIFVLKLAIGERIGDNKGMRLVDVSKETCL